MMLPSCAILPPDVQTAGLLLAALVQEVNCLLSLQTATELAACAVSLLM